jgi:SAM-dependent methyltransferase
MSNRELAERQRIEIEHWKQSPRENPESDIVTSFLKKAGEALILLDLIARYRPVFERARTILELGAGQGWAACMVKRVFPEARVVATDISEYAIASVWKWEYLCQVRLDGSSASLSYELAEPNDSLDLIFCFASAHHFGAHRRTLREVARVLKPGGTCLYLYEPTCPQYLHTLAHRRVNRIRPAVHEDVLVYRKIQSIATETGLRCQVDFYPSVVNRRLGPLLYYSALGRAPFLQRLLPCTANFQFTKAE